MVQLCPCHAHGRPLAAAYIRTRQILDKRWNTVLAVAQRLLAEAAISSVEISDIVNWWMS
jgi:hypothetical protein